LTGTCYNFEMEEFLASFCVARVCQRQLGFLVKVSRRWYSQWSCNDVAVPTYIRRRFNTSRYDSVTLIWMMLSIQGASWWRVWGLVDPSYFKTILFAAGASNLSSWTHYATPSPNIEPSNVEPLAWRLVARIFARVFDLPSFPSLTSPPVPSSLLSLSFSLLLFLQLLLGVWGAL